MFIFSHQKHSKSSLRYLHKESSSVFLSGAICNPEWFLPLQHEWVYYEKAIVILPDVSLPIFIDCFIV